ncbi:hypothetical protein EV714DRAFT_209670 [Schizophyllum commune]
MPPRRAVADLESATPPAPEWPMIENPFAQQVIDAANFADLVRTRFANEPERYRQFFDMMLWHEPLLTQSPSCGLNVQTLGVRAMQVFAGHPDLISGLRIICPKLPRPKEALTVSGPPEGYLDALVKERFREQPETYQKLRDIAREHGNKGPQANGTAKGKRCRKRKGRFGRPKAHRPEAEKDEKVKAS